LNGAGEGTSLMPDQFALQQGFRQRRAIDFDQRALRVAAVKMDRLADELFAGAALA
jgi:hypothetical protein